MKKISLLFIIALCAISCSKPGSPKEALEKALFEANGVEFTITEMTPIDTCLVKEVIENNLSSYNHTINVLSDRVKASEHFANNETVVSALAKAEYLKEKLDELQKDLTNKLDEPAYIDYQFSAVQTSGDDAISYNNAFCAISTNGYKVIGIGAKQNMTHKDNAVSIPNFDKFLQKAKEITSKEK